MSISRASVVEGSMLMEQPFAKAPFENYRKVFRASQKNIERDLAAVQTSVADLVKRTAVEGSSDPKVAMQTLHAMIQRVETLKRKLADLQEISGKPTQDVMRERCQHLAVLEAPDMTDADYAQWSEKRLDRWLVDWALRNGKEKTARRIAREKNMETLVDIDLFMDVRRIETALSHHSCTEALAWCNENKTALRKIKNNLEFDLRLQEYIELARAGRAMEAIAYMKKHLLPWQDTHLPQITQVSALVACPPSTVRASSYKRLYDVKRWETLVTSFRSAIYNLNTLSTEPLLHLSLYAGLASLKLPACYEHTTRNVDCPVCDESMGQLATEVPFSHHFNSTIVCGISGKIMDEDNMPMALPNGHVYSKEALEDMAARNGGTLICPRTHTTFSISDARKVFIS